MKILVIIINCLKVSNNPLSYTNTRSVFTEQDRFLQLLKTIESIKKYIPIADILLCEISDITKEYIDIISKLCNLYIMSNVPEIKYQRDSPYKGPTELLVMKKIFLEHIVNSYDYVLKLSGRYEINENFNINNLLQNKYYLKSFGEYMSTVFYGIPKDLYNNYIKCLNKAVNTTESIEYVLYPLLKDNSISVDKLGVMGYVSVSGDYYNV